MQGCHLGRWTRRASETQLAFREKNSTPPPSGLNLFRKERWLKQNMKPTPKRAPVATGLPNNCAGFEQTAMDGVSPSRAGPQKASLQELKV